MHGTVFNVTGEGMHELDAGTFRRSRSILLLVGIDLVLALPSISYRYYCSNNPVDGASSN